MPRPIPAGPDDGPAGGAARSGAGPLAPPSGASARRTLVEEVLVVLSLSLLASAVFSVIDMFTTPLRGATVALYAPAPLVAQVATIAFNLAPVWLVVHLARRSGEQLAEFGLAPARPRADAAWGVLLGLAVASVGLGLYLAAVHLGVNRFVDPAPPLGHWWTVPLLILGAVQAGLLEEIVVVGYLVSRLERLGWAVWGAVAASALLRGSYHLYQGWGGFAGNVAMGLLFASIFVRWRRTWPLVTAHALIDTLAGLGYVLFHQQLPH